MKVTTRNLLIVSLIVIVVPLLILITLYNIWEIKPEINNGDVLSAVVTVFSSAVGIIGVYSIFFFERYKSKEDEREYDVEMIYELLKNTVNGSESTCNSIFDIVFESYKYCISFPHELSHISAGEKYIGAECIKVDLSENKRKVDECILNNNLSKLVYDHEWTKYLKSVESKDRATVIKWMNILTSSDIDSYELFNLRDKIIDILEGLDICDKKFNDTYMICTNAMQTFRNGNYKFKVCIQCRGKYYNLTDKDFISEEDLFIMNYEKEREIESLV